MADEMKMFRVEIPSTISVVLAGNEEDVKLRAEILINGLFYERLPFMKFNFGEATVNVADLNPETTNRDSNSRE